MSGTEGNNTLTEGNKEEFTMTPSEQLSLGFSAANDVFSIFSTMNAGNSQATAYNFQAFINNSNAQALRTDAINILTSYGRQANVVREEGKRQRGQQIASMGASGFDVKSKSYRDIINETDRNIENNVAYIREEAMSKYASTMYQSKMQTIQADLNRASAKISKDYSRSMSIASGISAAAKIGAMSYFGGK